MERWSGGEARKAHTRGRRVSRVVVRLDMARGGASEVEAEVHPFFLAFTPEAGTLKMSDFSTMKKDESFSLHK